MCDKYQSVQEFQCNLSEEDLFSSQQHSNNIIIKISAVNDIINKCGKEMVFPTLSNLWKLRTIIIILSGTVSSHGKHIWWNWYLAHFTSYVLHNFILCFF